MTNQESGAKGGLAAHRHRWATRFGTPRCPECGVYHYRADDANYRVAQHALSLGYRLWQEDDDAYWRRVAYKRKAELRLVRYRLLDADGNRVSLPGLPLDDGDTPPYFLRDIDAWLKTQEPSEVRSDGSHNQEIGERTHDDHTA